jgi:hypothetical protein
MRMSHDAQPTGPVHLGQPAVRLPVDHLPRLQAQREPVPQRRGGLLPKDHQQILPKDHQQIIATERGPDGVRVDRVVLGDGDEVEPGPPGLGGELLRRQNCAGRDR